MSDSQTTDRTTAEQDEESTDDPDRLEVFDTVLAVVELTVRIVSLVLLLP
ncbi:hypothetical protein [Haloarchaeobius iranensis]|uniref:Uncharacterized protein n=1 Tax=Haloarchaeobius iranensis TaxID=996166 RepID=A0A1G9Y180_9EURY|nr:hypothetical protein [Haloarchaeobius iranensis]SDN02797.1 hypothetical protein SAMN05192554_11298 [Haloarchaeobius iranensis]